VAGGGPRQVQILHHPGAGRQLPRRTGPRGPQGPQPGHRREPGAGPGDPGPGPARPAGTGRVLRLPVLRGAAPGGSGRVAPEGSHPFRARARDDPRDGRLPSHRHRLDQHRDAARTAASSTVPKERFASSPSRPSWSGCSAVTFTSSAPPRTGGCSATRAAACSANRSTAAPGTPPARPRSGRGWPPPRSSAAPMTYGTPPCRCGSTPAARPPRSPPVQAASVPCTTFTCTASTATVPIWTARMPFAWALRLRMTRIIVAGSA